MGGRDPAAQVAFMLTAEGALATASSLINSFNDDRVCLRLLAHITRVNGQDPEAVPNGPKESRDSYEADLVERSVQGDGDEVTEELLQSYRATMWLTNEEPTNALLPYLGKKAKLITKSIFQVFQPNATGNLRHACRVIDHLMRLYLNDMYEVIGQNEETVKRYMGSMLRYIEHAPVAEVFLTLISKPHSTASLRFYASASTKKWMFYRSLSEWRLLLVLVEHITSDSFSEQHSVGAADVFLELLDRLAADENGQILLMPAAHCPELVEGLIKAAVDSSESRPMGQRTAAMKCLLRLLHKSSTEQVQGPPTSPYQSFGATVVNLVPNQLASLREPIYELAEKHMGELLGYLLNKYRDQQNIEMDLESGKPLPDGAVRHTGYVVKAPFTEFRLTLIEALVEVVAHNPSKMTEHFDANVWRVLLAWFFEYGHNNLYHAAFYQLVFIALRSDNQATLEILIKKLKLVTLLIEHYRDPTKTTSNKGYILQTCNAIRLQAASQSPDAFLRNFLQSHTTWRNFEPELRQRTNLACTSGLGFNVPQAVCPGFQKDTWQMIDEVQGIDHGSEYAKSLGFIDDVAWPEEEPAESGKKKKRKKKKKGSKDSAMGSENGDDAQDADDCHSSTNDENADPVVDAPTSSESNTSTPTKTSKSKTKKKKGKKK